MQLKEMIMTVGVGVAMACTPFVTVHAQQEPSIYGDAVKADVKMNYVYSFEEALKRSKQEGKPIFFNCFADWAVPCHTMNQVVFSDAKFCDYMNKHFVNLFLDVTRSEEGKALAQQYKVETFAQYLVLNEKGEVLLRILGGKKLPEFQEAVALALSDKTSLLGTEAKYNTGKYNKKDLLNYLNALSLAQDERYASVAKVYLGMLPEKEYAKKENWDVIRQSVVDRYSDLYSYLVAHRSDFVKSVGERTVNTLLERLYIPDLMDYACGKKEYDAGQLLALSTDMQKAEIPDASMCYLLYDIAKLRGTKKYPELIELMKTRGRELEGRRLPVELSFEFPELSKSERELIGGFLKEEAGRESEGSNSKKYLSALAQHILVGQEAGISFDVHTFAEAMEKAKAENKLVFMDCYTTWCGPCRMMAAQVFTQQKVGDYFNEHFVSLKMDMEKGEGITLGKKYGVTAYPTMLILDTQGNVMHTMVGSRSAEELIKEAREHSDPAKGYAVSKAAYEAGERTPDAIANYITALVSAKELTALQGDSLATTYLDGWDDAKFCDASSWPLLEAAVVNPQGKAFSRLLKLHDGLTKAVPAEKVNKKIERVCFPVVLDYLQHKTEKDAVLRLLEPLKQGTYPDEYTLVLIEDLLHRENVDDVLAFYRQRVQGMQNPQDQLNMDSLLPYFLEKATEAQKAKFVEYMTDRAKNCDKRAARKYAVLLEVIIQGGYKG